MSELEDAKARIKLLERWFDGMGIAMDVLREIARQDVAASAITYRAMARGALDRIDRVVRDEDKVE